MKYLIINWHWILIRQGQYQAARKLLQAINRKEKKLFLMVLNTDYELRDSGFVNFLKSHCAHAEKKFGCLFYIDLNSIPLIKAA
jgi:hypothetical protein